MLRRLRTGPSSSVHGPRGGSRWWSSGVLRLCVVFIVAGFGRFRQVVLWLHGEICDRLQRVAIGARDERSRGNGAEHFPAECGFVVVLADGPLEAPGDALPGSLLDSGVRGILPTSSRTQGHQIALLLLEGQFDDESRKDFYSQFAFLRPLDKFVVTLAELLDG